MASEISTHVATVDSQGTTGRHNGEYVDKLQEICSSLIDKKIRERFEAESPRFLPSQRDRTFANSNGNQASYRFYNQRNFSDNQQRFNSNRYTNNTKGYRQTAQNNHGPQIVCSYCGEAAHVETRCPFKNILENQENGH